MRTNLASVEKRRKKIHTPQATDEKKRRMEVMAHDIAASEKRRKLKMANPTVIPLLHATPLPFI